MSTEENNWGLPRELIPWGPTIDASRCRGSGECVKFCPNSVYELDAAGGRARVAHFHQCVVLGECLALHPRIVEDAKQARGLSSNSRVQAECCERREQVAPRWSEMAERRGRKRRANRPAR